MSVVRLYEEIVGRGGVSPAYFFDRMGFDEAAAFLRGMRRRERDELERTRLVMWSVFQSQSRRRLSPDDVFRLPGGEEEGACPDDSDAPAPAADVEALRQRAKQFER